MTLKLVKKYVNEDKYKSWHSRVKIQKVTIYFEMFLLSFTPFVHKFSVLRIALFTQKISKNVQIHLTSKTQFSLNAIRKV